MNNTSEKKPKESFALRMGQGFREAAANVNRWLDELPVMAEKLKDLGKTNFETGMIHMANGAVTDALMRFKISLYFRPNDAFTLHNLGLCYMLRGNLQEARRQFEKALAADPGMVQSEIMLALSGGKQISALPVPMVKTYFDGIAEQYNDEYVGRLKYQGHVLAYQALEKMVPQGPVEVLDIGCGTGLCGWMFRQMATRVHGIDVSPKMLEIASALRMEGKPVYDAVDEVDVRSFVAAQTEPKHDIAVAGLVVNYVGELTFLFGNIKKLLRPGGLLILSTEKLADGEGDYKLQPGEARFAHSVTYLRNMAAQYGLTVVSLGDVQLFEELVGVQGVFQLPQP